MVSLASSQDPLGVPATNILLTFFPLADSFNLIGAISTLNGTVSEFFDVRVLIRVIRMRGLQSSDPLF